MVRKSQVSEGARIGSHAIAAIVTTVATVIAVVRCASVAVLLELRLAATLTDVVGVTTAATFGNGWLVCATTFTIANITDHSKLSQAP